MFNEEECAMDSEHETKVIEKKDAKAYRTAGVAYFPVAAMFAVYVVLCMVIAVRMWNVTTDASGYGEYFIVWFVVFVLGKFYLFGAVMFAVVCALLGALLVWAGIALIKNAKNPDKLRTVKKAMDVFAIALAILLISAIPFILGVCRTVLRPMEEWKGFLLYGLMPFATSLVCVVLNRIAAHRFKTSNFVL